MAARTRRVLGLMAWGGAIYASLGIFMIPRDILHPLCGRWG